MPWFNLLTYRPVQTSGLGSFGAVGGGWTDPGSQWRLANLGGGANDAAVQTVYGGSAPWSSAQLVRKATNEKARNVRLRVRYYESGTDSQPTSNAIWLIARYDPAAGDANGNAIIIRPGSLWYLANGSISGTQQNGTLTSYNHGWYDVEVSVVANGSTTTITEKTWAVSDHINGSFAAGSLLSPSTGNVYSTTTYNDISGGHGFFFYQPQTANIANFSADSDVAASSLVVNPSSTNGSTGSSLSFSVTPNGAQNGGTLTLSDGGAGGTFSPSSPVLAAGVSAAVSFTYVPAASGNIVITVSSSDLTGSAVSGNATVSVGSSAASALTITPSSQTVQAGMMSGLYTVSTNGALASGTTVSLSDAGASGSFVPTSLSLASGSGSTATFRYRPATGASGTKSLTAGASGLTSATASAVVTPVTLLAPTHSSVVVAPYTWVTTILNSTTGDNTAIRAWNAGAYVRVYVTGSANVGIVFGASSTSAQFVYSIDNGLPSSPAACLNSDVYLVNLPDTGAHVVTFTLFALPQNSGRWSGTLAVTINGFQLASGGSGVPATRGSRNLLIYGDSITEGIQSRDGSDGITTSYSFLLGEAFLRQGWEYGIKGAGSSGYAVAVASGNGGQPPAWTSGNDTLSSWNKVDGSGAAGAALTVGGTGNASERFATQPDLIVEAWGTNDGLQGVADATLQSTIIGLFQRLRVAAPSSVIVTVVPFGGYKRTAIQSAAAAVADPRLIVIDAQTDTRMTQIGYCGNLLAGTSSGQNVHPWSLGSAHLAALLLRQVTAAYIPFATARPFGSAT